MVSFINGNEAYPGFKALGPSLLANISLQDVARTIDLTSNLQRPPRSLVPAGEADRLVRDDFMVYLKRGSSPRTHFNWIGVNLSQIDREYRFFDETNSYRILVDAERITGLILYDPSVDRALQNVAVDVGFRGGDLHVTRSRSLQKRQPGVAQRPMPWFAKMLTIDREQPLDDRWYMGVSSPPILDQRGN